MKVKALIDFYDLKLRKNIPAEKVYDVTDERARQLVDLGLVCMAEPKTEEKPNRRKKKDA